MYFLFFEVLSTCSKQDSQVFLVEDPMVRKLESGLARLPGSAALPVMKAPRCVLVKATPAAPKALSLLSAVQTPPPAPFLDRLHRMFLAFSRI